MRKVTELRSWSLVRSILFTSLAVALVGLPGGAVLPFGDRLLKADETGVREEIPVVGEGTRQDDPVAAARVSIEPDIVYGHKDGMAMTMDLFRPAKVKGRGAVVFIVSGGWVSRWAPPRQMEGFLKPYLDAGYPVFAVRHGSSPRYGIPDATSDVRRAIRFLRSRADSFGIDPDRLGVIGMSAGGHLALMLATTGDDGDPDSADPISRESSRIRTAVALVPPTDLRHVVWEAEGSLPMYRQFPALDMSVEQAGEYSPRLMVTPDDAPALIVSGLRDDLVPPEHGRWIAAAYDEQEVPHRLLLLEMDHGLQGKQQEVLVAAIEWLDEQLRDEDR